MSTIPNHTSSERSTAHDDAPSMSHGVGRRQERSDHYSEHSSSIHDMRHGGPSGTGPPQGNVRPTVSTSRESVYHNERGYMTSVHDTERGGVPLTPHGSYTSNGSFSSQPPPPSHSASSRPAPLPQPPIATLESNSPTSSQPLKKRKSMYDPPHVSHSPTAPSPPTSASPATPATTSSIQQAKESVKRTKTSRACDPCRRKKIRYAN